MYRKMKNISCLIDNKYIFWTSFVSFFFWVKHTWKKSSIIFKKWSSNLLAYYATFTGTIYKGLVPDDKYFPHRKNTKSPYNETKLKLQFRKDPRHCCWKGHFDHQLKLFMWISFFTSDSGSSWFLVAPAIINMATLSHPGPSCSKSD